MCLIWLWPPSIFRVPFSCPSSTPRCIELSRPSSLLWSGILLQLFSFMTLLFLKSVFQLFWRISLSMACCLLIRFKLSLFVGMDFMYFSEGGNQYHLSSCSTMGSGAPWNLVWKPVPITSWCCRLGQVTYRSPASLPASCRPHYSGGHLDGRRSSLARTSQWKATTSYWGYACNPKDC